MGVGGGSTADPESDWDLDWDADWLGAGVLTGFVPLPGGGAVADGISCGADEGSLMGAKVRIPLAVC
jgi:hypothetical protein